jgi:hypothetical protein
MHKRLSDALNCVPRRAIDIPDDLRQRRSLHLNESVPLAAEEERVDCARTKDKLVGLICSCIQFREHPIVCPSIVLRWFINMMFVR